MALTVSVPEKLAARVAAEASRRGVSVEEVVAQALATGLPGDLPPLEVPRRLAFIGIGSSTSGRGGASADEMLAEGFGRD